MWKFPKEWEWIGYKWASYPMLKSRSLLIVNFLLKWRDGSANHSRFLNSKLSFECYIYGYRVRSYERFCSIFEGFDLVDIVLNHALWVADVSDNRGSLLGLVCLNILGYLSGRWVGEHSSGSTYAYSSSYGLYQASLLVWLFNLRSTNLSLFRHHLLLVGRSLEAGVHGVLPVQHLVKINALVSRFGWSHLSGVHFTGGWVGPFLHLCLFDRSLEREVEVKQII